MERLSTTPFGRRPVTAGLLAVKALAAAPAPSGSVDKWQVFRDLTEARECFGLSSRSLTVLNALLSFHPEGALSGDAPLIVFPSNRTLGARAHGMAESTLRRHLAALGAAGMILRHDSPNGKRYAQRGADGAAEMAFGFDLRPLLVRAPEIAQAAEAARAALQARQRHRQKVVLLLRDATKLLDYLTEIGGGQDLGSLESQARDIRLRLRRNLSVEAMAALEEDAVVLLKDVEKRLESRPETGKISGKDSQTERHYHNSNPESFESENCQEKAAQAERDDPDQKPSGPKPLPLTLVTKACPTLSDFAPDPIRRWQDLVAAMDRIRPWMGISAEAWTDAKTEMGPATAATVAACILERGDGIASPGGYLRALTRKTAEGAFTPGPMVMALLTAERRNGQGAARRRLETQ